MDKQTRVGMHNAAGEFHSKMRTIRSKNLKNFLKLYYNTYVVHEKETRPIRARMRFGARRPRIRPGLRFIESQLGCKKAAAQDYLRAIQITHDFLFEHELNRRRILRRISRKDYRKLLRDLSQIFEHIAQTLGVKKKSSDKTMFRNVRNSLRVTSTIIEESTGVFTPQNCAKILLELASWMS